MRKNIYLYKINFYFLTFSPLCKYYIRGKKYSYIKIKEDLSRDIEKDVVIHKIKVILKRNLEHYKCPANFVFVKHIPQGATGKKIRKKIGKEYYLGEQK